MDATQISQPAPQIALRRAKHTILFFAADPLGMDQRALDQEARAIQHELECSAYRDMFELVTRWAVQPLDLLRELRRLKPTVVHFCGHGRTRGEMGREAEGAVDALASERDGLFFHGPDGRPQLVSPAALEEAFSAAGTAVRVVVLSACYSAEQASGLVAHVACVVGIASEIRDTAARDFAIGFYGALGDSESVGAAFQQGLAAIRLQGPMHSNQSDDAVSVRLEAHMSRPQLLTRPGVDPNKVYVLHRPDQRTRCSIVIRATLADFDAVAIARVRKQLRMLSGDVSLEIVEVQEGSVKLTVTLSPEAAARLMECRDRRELRSLLGFDVSSIYGTGFDVSPIHDAGGGEVKGDEAVESSRDERWAKRRAEELANHWRTRRAGERIADFAGAKLRGAIFRKVNLCRADFLAADLVGAELSSSDLTQANLGWADLRGANLDGALLDGACLTNANLERAILRRAHLTVANLKWAILRGADLRDAFLRGAKLVGADLRGARLESAFLEDADLRGANLAEADLRGAILGGEILGREILGGEILGGEILGGAILKVPPLKVALLRGAHFHGADLRGADLRGVHLEGAHLEGAHLEGALFDEAVPTISRRSKPVA